MLNIWNEYKIIIVHIQQLLKIDKTRDFYAYIVLLRVRGILDILPHQRSWTYSFNYHHQSFLAPSCLDMSTYFNETYPNSKCIFFSSVNTGWSDQRLLLGARIGNWYYGYPVIWISLCWADGSELPIIIHRVRSLSGSKLSIFWAVRCSEANTSCM